MAEEQLRLGGMALANGVLVHGPNAWACAIRHPDGRLEVASAFKRYRSSGVTNPLLRGPARLAEAIALLPQVRRRLPGTKLPFERPRVLTSMIAGAVVAQFARGSRRLGPAAQELVAALASRALAASTEIFSWMVRNPDHPLSKALARPGHEIQHRLATAEPTAAQLEVAEAALAACLELEHG